MARIRTIKPEFFRHADLYEAERETGLPLRLAFAGLWTAADREGRFKWKPRELKLDCLPHDDVDFSRVLDALVTRGWLVRYAVNGVTYGAIPTWGAHQIVNNREKASDIPEPNENNMLTREARVDDAKTTPLKQVQGEGKGKEGEGKEISSAKPRPSMSSDFEELKRRYPKRLGDYKWALAERKFNALVKTGVPASAILAAVLRMGETQRKLGNIGTQFVPMPASWLNSEDFVECAVVAFEPEAVNWDAICDTYKRLGIWSRHAPGNGPDSPGCLCPREILDKYGIGYVTSSSVDAPPAPILRAM